MRRWACPRLPQWGAVCLCVRRDVCLCRGRAGRGAGVDAKNPRRASTNSFWFFNKCSMISRSASKQYLNMYYLIYCAQTRAIFRRRQYIKFLSQLVTFAERRAGVGRERNEKPFRFCSPPPVSGLHPEALSEGLLGLGRSQAPV
jgi:hypothetical protein